MPTIHNTPGVYIEEAATLPPSVAEVPTAIPIFIGYTQYARIERTDESLTLKPVKIFSLTEFRQYFGSAQEEDNGITVTITDTYSNGALSNRRIQGSLAPTEDNGLSKHNLYYAMQLYFANGGGACYVVSVKNFESTTSTVTKGELEKGLEVLPDEATLIVIPEAIHLGSKDMADLYSKALNKAAETNDKFVIMDVKMNGTGTDPITEDINAFRDLGFPGENRKFGAAYYPYLDTTIDYSYNAGGVAITHQLIGAPDDLQPEYDQMKLTGDDTDNINAKDKSLYFQILAAIAQIPLQLPPSPAIAGVYSQVDRERGVWKAPANVNITGISRPALSIDDSRQSAMNVDSTSGISVNAIRSFPGKGTVVWGARTLHGVHPEWKYINVRRLFNLIEESIRKTTDRFLFEPNTTSTWLMVKTMLDNYLYGLWQRGALAGSRPEQAFFVKVGAPLPDDIKDGIMRVEVGISVVRPAEFIIIRFSQQLQQA